LVGFKDAANGSSDFSASGTGWGCSIAHHGEILQGVFEDDNGRLHRGLVTLPLDRMKTAAVFKVVDKAVAIAMQVDKPKAYRAAELTLAYLGDPDRGGELFLESSIPVGHGYGSSTADVVATIRAVSAGYGVKLRRSTICRLAVEAEGASDAIPYEDQAVLFAQREGNVIEHFGDALPPLLLVGFKACDGKPVDTLKLVPARYDSEQIQLFRVLRGLACRSIHYQDPYLLGHVATSSALISQRHLPKPGFKTAMNIAEAHHACGVQVAHSGSLIGILLDGTQKGKHKLASNAAKAVGQAGFKDVGIFPINCEEADNVGP